MEVLHDGPISNDLYIPSDDGWCAVIMPGTATSAVVVGENALDASTSAPIGPGSQLPYRVTSGGLHIRTTFSKSPHVKVVWWGEYEPATIIRPVIGSTAKDRNEAIFVPADNTQHTIESPSTGQFALTITASPHNLGVMRVASTNKSGTWLSPGQQLFLPQFNGTVQARYEPAADESGGEIVSIKHENDFNFSYDEVTP